MQIEMPFVFGARIKLNEHNQKHTHDYYYIYFIFSLPLFSCIVLRLGRPQEFAVCARVHFLPTTTRFVNVRCFIQPFFVLFAHRRTN